MKKPLEESEAIKKPLEGQAFLLAIIIATVVDMESEINFHDPPAGMPGGFYEYVLPVSERDFDVKHFSILDGWFRNFIGVTSSEAKTILDDHWKFGSTATNIFKSHLLGYDVKSIVVDDSCNGDAWLALNNRETDTTLIVPKPKVLSDDERVFLTSFAIPALLEFGTYFSGVFEDITPYVSSLQIAASPVDEQTFVNCGKWVNGVWLYQIADGDNILLSIDGAIGRWSMIDAASEKAMCVRDLKLDFDKFVNEYVKYLNTPFFQRKDSIFW